MNTFQENILEHYKNPRNFGKPEWQSTSINEAKNISCGDEIKIYCKISNNIIENLAFEGEGCSIAIASASIITEEFQGQNKQFATTLSDDEFIKKYIGIELTPSRKKCALLALIALKASLS